MKVCIPLERKFFEGNTPDVAKNLLGKLIVREVEGKCLVAKIVEVEAYLGQDDPAAHSFIGKTERNKVMFGEPGRAYVYRIHQQHCFNVVTRPAGIPHGVLIRAAEPIRGFDFMKKQREKTKSIVTDTDLLSGPGKICQAMSIGMGLYEADITDTKSPLKICKGRNERVEIEATNRVGITKAKKKKLRFLVKGNKYVSN